MKKNAVIMRASAMLALVGAVVVGATFALPPTSAATLSNNTLETATTSLKVDGPDQGDEFSTTEAGFSFDNLLPGATNFSLPQSFRLKNDGETALHIAVAKTGDATGTLDPTKVHIFFKNMTAQGTPDATYTLAELAAGAKNLPGVSAANEFLGGDDPTTEPADGEVNEFFVAVKLDEGASDKITGFNLVFTGTAVEDLTNQKGPEETPQD